VQRSTRGFLFRRTAKGSIPPLKGEDGRPKADRVGLRPMKIHSAAAAMRSHCR
jgi:hypothetical protein